MKIKIEKSGGIAGIATSKEIDANRLNSSLQDAIKKLLDGGALLTATGTKPKGAADYLNYKITLQDGTRNRVIDCNQFEINGNLRKIIKYINSGTDNPC